MALSNTVNALAVYNGELYAGGVFTDAGGDPEADGIAKWNGSSWSDVGGAALSSFGVYSFAVYNGELYAGGVFTDAGGDPEADSIAKWNGVSWSDVGGAALVGGVFALAVYDGELYVGGNYTNAAGDPEADRIAKWNGSSWSDVGGAALSNFVRALAVYDGELYVGGDFLNAGGDPEADRIVRWNGSSWSDVGGAALSNSVRALAVYDGELYLGGNFQNAGGDPEADGIAKWNGASWSDVGGAAPSGGVNALAVYNGELYMGGTFGDAGGDPEADCIAKWNGASWSDVGGVALSNTVNALAVYNGELYVGGAFTDAGGDPEADEIAKFSSADDVALGSESATWPAGTWRHVAVSYDGSTAKIYVNGVLESSSAASISLADSSQELYIGTLHGSRGAGFNGHQFDGLIDDVRIYNRALSADEIKRLYKIGATAKLGVAPNNGTLASGLVGYWTFDGPDIADVTAYDRSGQGNNGTLTNGPTRIRGKIGQALNFDGSDDVVNIGDSSQFDGTSQLSVALWMKRGGRLTTEVPISKWDWQNDSSWMIQSAFGNGSIRVSIADTPTDSGLNYVNTATGLLTTGWHHVALTYNGSGSTNLDKVRIYIDGVSRGTGSQGTIPTSILNSATPGQIGDVSGLDQPLEGLIDDVRIYNRALSADEIKRLYKIGATAKQGVAPNNGTLASGLVGYWPFDGPDISSDASGIITAYDRSGNGNYGTSTTSQAPKTARGKIGQGLRFDGVSNNSITVAANSSINTLGPMTVSAWIYPNTLGQSSIGAIATKGGGWWFRFNANRILQFLVFYNGGLSFILKPTANNVVSLNTWQHVLVTWDGVGNASGVRIFINGSETAYGSPVNPSGGRVDDSVYQLTIGNYVSSSMDFDGTIDDVRIYNRALTPDEVKRLYNIGR